MIDLTDLEIKTSTDKILHAVKQLELQILEEVDRICRKNNIEYSISGGTMLGAIRHGGFIPWDDDIDIELTAKNYDRLLEACKKELDKDKYFLLTHESCPKFNDFPAKIILKNTLTRSKSAKKADLPLTLCVDIFKLDYMPNDFEKRKEISHKLFNLRQCMLCKTYDNITFLKDPNDRKGKNLFNVKYVSRNSLYKKIKKIENKCNKKYNNSDYLYDNCIYHVGYYGEPNFDKIGYEDVQFEGLTVRKFKQHHEYLCNLFGDDYMEMPPVENRVTHHNYIEFDLGKYAQEYDLPQDYEKYMIDFLNADRLIHMKNLCLDMLDEIDRICNKYNIKYFLSGDDIIYKAEDIEEMCKLWRKDVCVFMDRDNLEKFNDVVESELDKKYFYQNSKTDPEYIFYYPKIRLKGTYLRDRTLVPANINEGLWVNIGIIVNTSNDKNESKKYYEELRQINEDMKYKCLYDDIRTNNLKNMKNINDKEKIEFRKRKIKRIQELKNITLEELLQKREDLYRKYENEDTKYVVEISTTMLKATQIKKEDIDNGIIDTLLGRKYNFPKNYKSISNTIKEEIPERAKKYKKLKYIKENEPERYQKAVDIGAKNFLIKLNKKYSSFNLSSYDVEEYMLSVLDFDEPK